MKKSFILPVVSNWPSSLNIFKSLLNTEMFCDRIYFLLLNMPKKKNLLLFKNTRNFFPFMCFWFFFLQKDNNEYVQLSFLLLIKFLWTIALKFFKVIIIAKNKLAKWSSGHFYNLANFFFTNTSKIMTFLNKIRSMKSYSNSRNEQRILITYSRQCIWQY